MDEAFRKALREVQRTGGSFSQLQLDKLLNLEQLGDLQHHINIARLRLMGVTNLRLDLNFLYSGGYDEYCLNADKLGEEPKLIVGSRGLWETCHWTEALNNINTFEELPHLVIARILKIKLNWVDYATDIFKENYTILRKEIHCINYSKTRNTINFNLVTIWQEKEESFNRNKTKRLKERGLLPGRNS